MIKNARCTTSTVPRTYTYTTSGGGNPFGGAGGGGIDWADILESLRHGEGAFGTNWDFGGGARQAQPEKGADKKVTLTVSFDEAFNGAEKKVRVVNPETQEKETLTIKVPAGAMEGGRVRMKGKGHPGANGGAAGDLLVTIKIAPDANFSRKGADVITKLPVSIDEAALGAQIVVPGRNAGRRSAHAERSRCTTSRQERFGNGRLESRDRGQDSHHP